MLAHLISILTSSPPEDLTSLKVSADTSAQIWKACFMAFLVWPFTPVLMKLEILYVRAVLLHLEPAMVQEVGKCRINRNTTSNAVNWKAEHVRGQGLCTNICIIFINFRLEAPRFRHRDDGPYDETEVLRHPYKTMSALTQPSGAFSICFVFICC